MYVSLYSPLLQAMHNFITLCADAQQGYALVCAYIYIYIGYIQLNGGVYEI